jgi:acyl-CoA thioesterase FadM
VDWVKNSSLCFSNYIRLLNDTILVRASSVLVNVDPRTGESVPIGNDLRELIENYEQGNVKFLD